MLHKKIFVITDNYVQSHKSSEQRTKDNKASPLLAVGEHLLGELMFNQKPNGRKSTYNHF